jgi:Ca2+-binding EF-hand superfamily protein
VKKNFSQLKQVNKQEWSLCKAMDQYNLLENHYVQMQDMFEAIDLGKDGKVQVSEVCTVLEDSGVFSGQTADPDQNEDTLVTLDEQFDEQIDFHQLRDILTQFDVQKDGLIDF